MVPALNIAVSKTHAHPKALLSCKIWTKPVSARLTWTKHCVHACPGGTLLAHGFGTCGGGGSALSLAEREAPLRVVTPMEGAGMVGAGAVGGLGAAADVLLTGGVKPEATLSLRPARRSAASQRVLASGYIHKVALEFRACRVSKCASDSIRPVTHPGLIHTSAVAAPGQENV